MYCSRPRVHIRVTNPFGCLCPGFYRVIDRGRYSAWPLGPVAASGPLVGRYGLLSRVGHVLDPHGYGYGLDAAGEPLHDPAGVRSMCLNLRAEGSDRHHDRQSHIGCDKRGVANAVTIMDAAHDPDYEGQRHKRDG